MYSYYTSICTHNPKNPKMIETKIGLINLNEQNHFFKNVYKILFENKLENSMNGLMFVIKTIIEANYSKDYLLHEYDIYYSMDDFEFIFINKLMKTKIKIHFGKLILYNDLFIYVIQTLGPNSLYIDNKLIDKEDYFKLLYEYKDNKHLMIFLEYFTDKEILIKNIPENKFKFVIESDI